MSRVLAAALLVATVGGCVVEPAPAPYSAPAAYAAGPGPYAPPPGVAYVAPTYAIPGPGYLWRYHRRFGWGWWHPRYGWHRGWR